MSEENRDSLSLQNMGAQPVPCPNGQLYTIRSGDTMFLIAQRFNIPLQNLINANPQIANPNVIFPGQVICIPGVMPVFCPGGQVYRVVRGDTMFEIARRFGISLDALIRANPQITDPNRIFPGQEICIPGAPPVPCPNGTLYTVRSGDTMFRIARANNISLSALIAANPQISDPNVIFPGQVICVPAPMPQAELPQIEVPMEPQPVPIVPAPLPAPTPLPLPMPVPPAPVPMRPCPVEPSTIYPMPIYVNIPWDDCPYRCRKKKKHKKERHERRHCR